MKLKILFILFVILGLSVVGYKTVLARDGGPADQDPDINIRKRGWQIDNNVSPNALIDHPQNPDNLQPDLASSFNPSFTSFWQVYGRNGQNSGLDSSNVNSPGLATIQDTNGGAIKAPAVGRNIGNGFNYTILYISSDGRDITIHNGTEDSIVTTGGGGYSLHFLNIQVNPKLKQMYDANEASGRKQLVAIPCGYQLGTATGDVYVAIRDSGNFMDIRFKDWWQSSSPNCANVDPGTVDVSAGTTTPTKPFDYQKEVPCTDTTDPEFHSLRPYPASPCLKTVQDTTMMCANDLVVIRSTQPGPGGSCTAPAADGSYSCTYTNVPEHVPVAINLANAQLPILGNTEEVPNATWTSPNTNAPNLTPAQRVNGFVSWYLNGVINRAEEDFSSFNSDYLINYSGPINKLLPWTGQIVSRIISVNNADESKNGNTAPDGGNLVPPSGKNQRHNEIIGCDADTVILPCYIKEVAASIISQIVHFIVNTPLIDIKRLADFESRKPPLESDLQYKTFPDYWKAYLSWFGKFCSPSVPVLGIYACSNLQLFWPILFPNTPYSNTEDRIGLIGTSQIGAGSSGSGINQITNSELNSQYLQNLIVQAASWAHVPVPVLVALVHGEACQGGGPLCTASDQDVQSWSNNGGFLPYNCNGPISGGPLGFSNWTPWSNAVNLATGENRSPNVCNVKDAIYAAAYAVSSAYTPDLNAIACSHTSPQNPYNVANTPTTWTLDQMKNVISTAWVCGCQAVSACTNGNQRNADIIAYYNDKILQYAGATSVAPGAGVSSSSNAVTFTPDAGTNYKHNLYFAHAQESVELASKLQSTFKSSNADSQHDDNTKANIAPGCTVLDARGDPTGDSFHGDIDRGNDKKISGTVDFLATYTCHFKPITSVSGSTFQNGSGISGGLTYTCDPATASLGIFTKSPEVENAWDILVGGTQSIFKRFFPQSGANSPTSEIKETPAYTNITYEATGGDAVAAGGTNGGGSSTTAQAYIPYVGGIKDYFLDAIQTALRPKGAGGSAALTSGNGVVFPGGKIPAGLCSPSNLSSFGSNAGAMSCVCQNESGGNPFAKNTACLRGGTVDYSIGLFQINLLAHPSPVPDGLRAIFMDPVSHGYPQYAGLIPNPSTVSCYNAFLGKSPCNIKTGYDPVVQICVDWFSNPINNIAYARQLFSSQGISPWTGDRKACGL